MKLIAFALAAAACHRSSTAAMPDAPPPPPPPPDSATVPDAPPSTAACDVMEFGVAVCEGTLDPTTLGPGIAAIVPKAGAPAGSHFFCYPANAAAYNGKLLIHIVGTGSDPAGDHEVAARACSLGFAAIEPMYEDANAVRQVCADDGACYDGFHKEIIYGGDFAPDPVEVDASNSILNRIDTLVARLAASETRLPAWQAIAAQITARDFSAAFVSGHSQGGGHALYLARDFGFARALLLASPADRVSSPADAPAPWISSFAANTRTPTSHIYGFIHTDDGIEPYAGATANWTTLQLATPACAWKLDGSYAAACREIVIPSQGCSGVTLQTLAHIVPVSQTFNNFCTPGTGNNTNAATWQFLLS